MTASREQFGFGEPIEYGLGVGAASDLARQALAANYIVKITGFPTDARELADFSRAFGPLMPKYHATGDTPEDYVGDVRYRTDIAPDERLATERDGELRPHTAKSWALERPRYFGLLMVDPGWIDQPPGMNGESVFVRASDAVQEMGQRFSDSAEEDLHLLTATPVKFTATHIVDEVATMPLLFPIDGGTTLGIRYKENMLSVLRSMASMIPKGRRYIEAVERLDDALQTAPCIETPLQQGDLVVLGNRAVAHARRPFQAERTDGTGQIEYSPRNLYNIHIMPEEYQSL